MTAGDTGAPAGTSTSPELASSPVYRRSRLGRGVPRSKPSVVSESSIRMTASALAGIIVPVAICTAAPARRLVLLAAHGLLGRFQPEGCGGDTRFAGAAISIAKLGIKSPDRPLTGADTR